MKRTDIQKESIIELYIDKQLTMDEIAKIYNVNRTTISNRLKEYHINSNPNQRKNSHIKQVQLNQIQRSLVIGSVLGDASIILSQRRVTPYFKVAHCEKQKDYLLWKSDILKPFVNNVAKTIDKRGNSIMYSFNTVSHKELKFYHEIFYTNGIKTINKELINYLDALGLAVWFMDDGSKLNNCNFRISTDGFSEDENMILADILKSNFNLTAKVNRYQRNDKYFYYLSLDKDNAIKMNELISPFFVNCMKYKLIDPQRLHAKHS